MSTTSAEVIKLFPTESIATATMDPYIDDANLLVAEILASTSLTIARQDLIAKYLAAHLYVLAAHEGGIFEEEIGETKEKRGSTFTLGKGLELTRWGQMVLSLDSSGSFRDDMVLPDNAKKSALFRLV